VTWTFDVTPPTLVGVPTNVDVDCDVTVPPANVTGSDNCGGAVGVQFNETSQDADCSTGFREIITRRWTATDACGNTATASQTIRVRCCEVFCTYTQGAYGSAGGMMCNGEPSDPGPNQFTTFQLITMAINTYTLNSYTPPLPNVAPWTNQMLVIGKPGHSIYMNSGATDVNNIIKYLPGGGPSKELNAGDERIGSANFVTWYTKNNKIR
jgi:hypothetical protein